MPPEDKKLISDMLDAAVAVRQFVVGHTIDDLRSDKLLKSGVYWQFAVIGEALSQLRRQNPSALDHISEWNRIIGFRNQIIHGYSVIDDEITWRVIVGKLPTLVTELESMLA